MSGNNYILSHNLGTTGNYAALYDTDGTLVKSWFTPYSTWYGPGHKAEQDASDWWGAVCASTRGILKGYNEKSVAVVAFSGQMMGCLCLDREGHPLDKSVIWADMRSQEEADKLKEDIDEQQFYRITGHRISPSYSLAKLLWLRKHKTDVFNNTAKIVQAKDYMVFKLTGQLCTDYSDASGTNMFDLNSFTWSDTILSIARIDSSLLPEPVSASSVAGKVSFEAACETGLLPGTPVVMGAGDGFCSSLAGGCVTDQDTYMYMGSSSWISTFSDTPHFDDNLATFNWAGLEPGQYAPCGTMQAAGASLDWLQSHIALTETEQSHMQHCSPHELIDQGILNSLPGAGGLLYLPYLLGERSPWWNPSARGALFGLTMSHSRHDLFRAFAEGVALNMGLIHDSLTENIKGDFISVIGGSSGSDVRLQILSDVLGVPLVLYNHSRDSKTFGAAMLGALGAGIIDDLCEIKSKLKEEKIIQPREQTHALYNEMKPLFQDLYTSTSAHSRKLERLFNRRSTQ